MSVEAAASANHLDVAAAGFEIDWATAIFSFNATATRFAVKFSFQAREAHLAAARMRIHIASDVGNADHAAVGAHRRLKFLRNANNILSVGLAMPNLPIRFFSAGTNRDDVSFLGESNWNRGEIFFFSRFTAEVDFTMRFERHVVVAAGGHADGAEFDVDDEFSSGRSIKLL